MHSRDSRGSDWRLLLCLLAAEAAHILLGQQGQHLAPACRTLIGVDSPGLPLEPRMAVATCTCPWSSCRQFPVAWEHTQGKFHCLDGILWSTNMFNFDDVQLIYFFILLLVFLVSYLRNHCFNQSHEDLYLFSSKIFIVSALTFSSFIHFELIFVYGVM